MRNASCCLTALLCTLTVGCGSDSDLARVKGKVTLNGRPLEGAIVQFQPVIKGGSPSAGKTDSDGRYALMFSFDRPGAIPGEHVVTVRMASSYYEEEDSHLKQDVHVPAKYNTQSELKRTVKPGRNTIDLAL